MVEAGEVLFLLAVAAVGIRWYLHTPMHRARKESGVFPPQVAGHMGFGMYSPSNPPLLPHGLHDHRVPDPDQPAPDPETGPEPGDA